MDIYCKAGTVVRAVALAFTAGAILGAGVAGYAAEDPGATPAAHSTNTLPDQRAAVGLTVHAGRT